MANRLTTASGLSTPHNTTVCGSVSPSKTFDGAELFPVAVGVQVPYVGGGETSTRAHHAALALPEEYPLKLAPPSLGPTGATLVLGKGPSSPRDESSDKLGNLLSQYNTSSDKSNFQLPKSYLKKVCCGLTFDEGVLQDRAPHTLPYKEDELKSVFTTQGLVRPRQKHTGPVGRHDPRTGIQRHPPCHLQGPRKLKPLKRSKTVPRTIMDTDTERGQSTFGRRGVKGPTPAEQLSPDLSKHEWDEHVLASLSKTTADLIVKDHLTGPDKERLVTFLAKRNSALEKPDGMSDEKSDNASVKKTRRSPLKKSKDERKSQKDEAHQQDVHYSPCFTLPSRVGDKKLETHNIFQQEMLAGAQPVLSKKQEEGVIVLDTNDKLKFQKQLQDTYPQEPKVWYSQKKRMAKKKAKILPAGQKPTKGLQRWNQLPVVVQDDSYISSMPSNVVDLQTLTAGYKLRKKIKEDSNVVKIVEEWRSKWFLERKWQNSSTQELIKAMNDINDHVRLSAVSACSKAAEIRQKAKKEEPNLGIQLLDKNKEEEVPLISTLEPDLIDTIRKLLDDRNTQVRIAAAITLYTINRPDDKTRSILLWTMDHGGAPERWAATQCLALSGVITDNIIAELVSQLQSDTTVRAEKAGVLLADLSRHSGIVHSLIAELLNSSSWKDRVTACKVIPKLNGGINKDMTQKLSYLMWNDWSKDVRTVAAQALGRTGNGKLVHDALRERILTGNERVKVDALKKLSNLGIMTVRLLPALLECFKSEYVSVRIEAAMVAGLLHITDNKLISVLQYLSSDDKSWKVKAHAIKALGSIGVVDDKLIEVLVWAIRYDKVAAVRAEACNAAAVLGLRDARLLSVLQDRLVVESEDLVKREAISALQSLGIEPVGDVDMIEAIRKEVRRLCNRNAVVSHILAEDQAAEYKDDFKRLLTTQEAERESTMVTRLSLRPERTMSRASEASQRGWDPILAGYQAREILSRAPTPGELRMERSLLPMDLNSASSENSSVCGTENWSEGEGHGGADYPEGEGYGLGDYSGEEGDGTVDRVRPGKEFENNMENAKLENGGSGSEETGSASNELDLNTVKVPFQDHNHTNDSRDNEAKRETPAKEERAAEYESSMGEPELLRLVEEEEEEEEEDDSAL